MTNEVESHPRRTIDLKPDYDVSNVDRLRALNGLSDEQRPCQLCAAFREVGICDALRDHAVTSTKNVGSNDGGHISPKLQKILVSAALGLVVIGPEFVPSPEFEFYRTLFFNATFTTAVLIVVIAMIRTGDKLIRPGR